MLPTVPRRKRPDVGRELLALLERLTGEQQQQLLDFAEFLAARAVVEPVEEDTPAPRDTPRPAKESVVAAIRRLSDTYFMLDRGPLLNDTSALMSAHILGGRPAAEVIDELEVLFEERYRKFRDGKPEKSCS